MEFNIYMYKEYNNKQYILLNIGSHHLISDNVQIMNI